MTFSFALPESKRLIYFTRVSGKSAEFPMRLESEVRNASTLEQHFVHGKWRIVKIYVRGELSEISVSAIR